MTLLHSTKQLFLNQLADLTFLVAITVYKTKWILYKW